MSGYKFFPYLFFKISHFAVNKEHINEKFTQDSDPIQDMGIGMLKIIKEFCESAIEGNNIFVLGHAISHNLDDLDNLLIICVETSKYDYVENLLNMGANIHTHGALNMSNEVPLRYAIWNNDIRMIDLLLKYDANILKAIDRYELKLSILNKETVKHVKKIIKKQKL